MHNSLGLQALCGLIRESDPCDILELGPVRSRSVEFWARLNPSIFVADLRSSLPLPVLRSEEDEVLEPDWGGILRIPQERTFDVILAWDLLNYMAIADISSLVRYLEDFCRSGTLLFYLIFDRKEMPADIAIYSVIDPSHLAYEHSGTETKECPRHQPRALLSVMSNFNTVESFRLRNGVVEYVHIYER
ncbi:MAG: hypothetical protein P8Z37_08555 [Acidobacteriota bacterium]